MKREGERMVRMTDEDHARLAAEYAELQADIASLDAAIAEREEAKARAAATARAVGARLARLGHFAAIAGEAFDPEVARLLYWQYPDVHVAEIAHPMNIHEGTVNRHVGDGNFEGPCLGGCGNTVQWTMKSRTDTAALKRRYCADCAERNDREREVERARWQARMNAEHRENVAALKEAMATGGGPVVRYAEFRGVGGTWQVDESGVPFAIKDG